MIKKEFLKRLSEAESRAKDLPEDNIEKIIKSLSTAELLEIVAPETTESRIFEIIGRAKKWQ